MNTKPKILIVDDKSENLFALRTVLKDMDIEPVEATSGNDALKATLRHDFVLALLDIQMPGMDGYELAGILREEEKTAHLPFIFISAVYTDNLNVFKGYEKGAFSFITKPFQPEILINKVKFFIDKHKQEIALFELNKELAFMNKELESFSYSVSHDLRAPLRGIDGWSLALVEDYGDQLDEKALQYLGRVRSETQRMGWLIDDLLKLSRVSQMELRMAMVDLSEIIQTVSERLQEAHPGRQFLFAIQPGLVTRGDAKMLEIMLTNLMGNACKFTGKMPVAKIEFGKASIDHKEVYFIKDNGVGFNMANAKNLFGAFQRMHKESEFPGTGIGLATVQRIVRLHKGTIWAEASENQGATFYFTIPD
ncbi:MAG: response regulator [Chitinophagaceae bacterium]|nr:response regulator [Chitinophagaceae bacterium]MDP3666980.1 response regulator [Sediminibacterium sp.]